MFPIRIKACSESDLRMLGNLARNIQRVLPVTQADIDAAAALGKGWVVWKVIEVNDPIDNLRGGTQLVIKQNSITPGQNVRRVLIVSGPGGETVVIGPGPSPLLLPDAIANSLSYVKAFGGTEQNGTPTPDTPVDIVSNNGVLKYSANMTNVNAQTALIGYYISATGVVTASTQNWIYQDYIPVEPNTTYTITMSSPVYFVSISEYSTADDSGFIVRDASGSGTHTQFTITTSANTHFVRFGANIDGSSSVTLESVLAINWMLNKGNSMPYTPYSPTGVYADGTVETINAHGKNLFDSTPYKTGYYIDASGNDVEITQYQEEYLIRQAKVQPSTQYTISFKGIVSGYTQRIHAYDAAGNWLSQLTAISTVSVGVVSSKSFITPANCAYVRQGGRSQTEYQLEQGSTATAYEPYYNGGTATAEMLLKVGDYKDVQSILDGVVTRNVGVAVLDGTEDWAFRNQTLSLFYGTIANTYFDDNQANHLALSTHFLGVEVNNSSMPDNSCKCASLSGTYKLQLFIKSTNFASPEDLKSWLSAQYAAGTPVIVVYQRATPTTESVAGQALQVTDGDNVLEITQASLSGLQLEAEYTKVA